MNTLRREVLSAARPSSDSVVWVILRESTVFLTDLGNVDRLVSVEADCRDLKSAYAVHLDAERRER